MPLTIAQPGTDEYAEFHQGYISATAREPDGVALVERQAQLIDRLGHLTPEQAAYRYAAGKWNLKEMVGHLSDSERIVSYRLLRIARGDTTPLAGFDENIYVTAANSDRRSLEELVGELAAVRAATIALVKSLDDTALMRRGVVNTWTLSARALVFIIAGHFQHHIDILRDRYGVVV